jgi:ABC-2 type transport system ATP-binding protein
VSPTVRAGESRATTVTTPARDTCIEARALGYRYRAPRHGMAAGIANLDLDVASGDIVGVLGPNGAGKSTLLRVLATAAPPHTGTLRLLGEAAAPPRRALRRRIGYAGDDTAHFGMLDGVTNAMAFAQAAGVRPADARVAIDALLQRFELAARATSRVSSYSHGMRRKLGLVEALAHAPPLLLLDEPTTGLDERARATLLALLRERAAAGATIVIATHDLDFAAALCTRVVFLRDGAIALHGEPAALLRSVPHRTVISVALRARTGAAPRFDGPGHILVSADGGCIELQTPSDSSVLPAFCAALVAQRVPIRSISVRSADLRDVFIAATGAGWSAAP